MMWWFHADVLDDWSDGSSRSGASNEYISLKTRAETSQEHADYRIKNCRNEYDRIDAILALKRSMQARLEHLDSIYGLKQYPQSKTVGWLGLLEEWGVIRQRVLRRMNLLRNAVEHDGAQPPDLDTCEDYAEVNWWFLKATTPMLLPMIDVAVGSGPGVLNLGFSYKPLNISISGTLLPEMLSDSGLPGWIAVEEARAEPVIRDHENPERNGQYIGHWRLSGNVHNPAEATLLLKRAFEELVE